VKHNSLRSNGVEFEKVKPQTWGFLKEFLTKKGLREASKAI